MSAVTVASARSFVESIDLPLLPGFEIASADGLYEKVLDAHKDQALVVASDIISFVKGVSDQRRKDIVNSCLLAQLAANKSVPGEGRILEWYNAYFETLERTGWVIQEKAFTEYAERGDGVEAHEAILGLATTLLGPAATALAVIKSALDSLKSINQNQPWITLFDRNSRRSRAARFQVTLADQNEDGQLLVSLMAFSLEGEAITTQVLFFKIRKNTVGFKSCSGKVTINEDVISGVRDLIRNRIIAYANDYIAALPDLG